MGVMDLIDEMLEDTGSDQQSSTWLTEASTIYHTTYHQDEQDNSQSLLTHWETE
jgi:hypothetical protein